MIEEELSCKSNAVLYMKIDNNSIQKKRHLKFNQDLDLD